MLLRGGDAVDRFAVALDALPTDAETWEQLSRSTGFTP